jgi:hypothetical protein
MPSSEKDCLATEVQDRWAEFQNGLSDKRRYPLQPFKAFVEAARRYAERQWSFDAKGPDTRGTGGPDGVIVGARYELGKPVGASLRPSSSGRPNHRPVRIGIPRVKKKKWPQMNADER